MYLECHFTDFKCQACRFEFQRSPKPRKAQLNCLRVDDYETTQALISMLTFDMTNGSGVTCWKRRGDV